MTAHKANTTRAAFQQGFIITDTLLVLTVAVLLALVGMYSYANHMRHQSYSKAESALHNARLAAADAIRNADNLHSQITQVSVNNKDELANLEAKNLLPGFQLPESVRLQVYYDPDCTDNACESLMIQADDCKGGDFARYTQYGDGLKVLLEGVPGSSCGSKGANFPNASSPIYSQLSEALS